MKNIKKLLNKIWQDESGQGATEYILMIVVVVGIILAFKEPITTLVRERVDGLKDELGKVTN